MAPHGPRQTKVAQLARKGRADLQTARRTVRSKQRLLDDQENLRILRGYRSCNRLELDSIDL
jgi:hypothetical protein